MSTVELILVPYHLGHRNRGMGAGPTRLLDLGAAGAVEALGHQVAIKAVELSGRPLHEIGATFDLNRSLAATVQSAVGNGAFPLILAGNCNSCLGTVAGLRVLDIGIAWFDAHGDFNSPESSATGFFDGMALNAAVGGCWRASTKSIPGFEPVAENRVGLIGVRDLDPDERRLLEHAAVGVVEYATLRRGGLQEVVGCLDAIGERAKSIYVHVDLDVMDRETVPANEFSPDGGLALEELDQSLLLVGERFDVRAAALTAYNPDFDVDGQAAAAALSVIGTLAGVGCG
ncbi:MAG: arginase family protein [Gemmatimonadota bacterium]|nr:MAG: arginase family protein [Gemmatimonadota bacterium]